jgi:hypothetical protein
MFRYFRYFLESGLIGNLVSQKGWFAGPTGGTGLNYTGPKLRDGVIRSYASAGSV